MTGTWKCFVLALGCVLLMLVSCGKKGPPYLPEKGHAEKMKGLTAKACPPRSCDSLCSAWTAGEKRGTYNEGALIVNLQSKIFNS